MAQGLGAPPRFFRGPELSSQNPSWQFITILKLQELCCPLLASLGFCTHEFFKF